MNYFPLSKVSSVCVYLYLSLQVAHFLMCVLIQSWDSPAALEFFPWPISHQTQKDWIISQGHVGEVAQQLNPNFWISNLPLLSWEFYFSVVLWYFRLKHSQPLPPISWAPMGVGLHLSCLSALALASTHSGGFWDSQCQFFCSAASDLCFPDHVAWF